MNPFIYKFLNRTLSEDEWPEFLEWLNEPKNKATFQKYVRVDYYINKSFEDKNIEQDYKAIAEKLAISPPKTKVRSLKHFYYVAASITVLLGIVFALQKFSPDNTIAPVDVVINNIKTGTYKATLTMEDGSELILENGIDYKTTNASSDGKHISYLSDEQIGETLKPLQKQIAYNTLTIPRGGQFQIILEDGTIVWLNSESQLKYPVNFISGEPRSVELVYGEAYFKVSPSNEHKGSHFKVITSVQEVEVLGTEFNVKAYLDEINIYTTLAEGKVIINYQGLTEALVPGQQSILNVNTNVLSTAIVNIDNVTSWRQGVFNFKRMPLKDIMIVLSRWYNMDVVFEDKELESKRFIGALKKDQSIESILSSIQSTGIINTYEIHDKTVIIK